MEPPPEYKPIRTPARKFASTPAPIATQHGFVMSEDTPMMGGEVAVPAELPNLPAIKPEDRPYFEKLLTTTDEEEANLPIEEQKERKLMKLLLRVCALFIFFSNLCTD